MKLHRHISELHPPDLYFNISAVPIEGVLRTAITAYVITPIEAPMVDIADVIMEEFLNSW